MPVEFTAHNIRLDNGTFTKPENGSCMDTHPWFVSAKGLLNNLFPGDKSSYRLVDLGCLEGGYAVEFARLGFQVLGLEVRESNFAACCHVKANTSLPNLQFVKDDAWNLGKYGKFDVVFCCGLFYHLDRPRQFLGMLAEATHRALILQTHFADRAGSSAVGLPWPVRLLLSKLKSRTSTAKFSLSKLTTHEGLPGRWFFEFPTDHAPSDRERLRWASWENNKSFWIQREYLLQAIREVGFDVVLEQFDGLGPTLGDEMTRGFYATDSRGTFVGLKSAGNQGMVTEPFAVPDPARKKEIG